MGFKADTSFLRFLSMGAIGVRQTLTQLKAAGFQPIELERYCGSNKIWATKVKRLRLPDVLCVKTGLRLEIRAKSDLQIKMSDAEKNAERRWDVGLRDEDIVAFIAIVEENGVQQAAEKAIFFEIKDLRDSVATSKLGEPKSAGEGAERDRTWPACIPSKDGTVLYVDPSKIIAEMNGEGDSRRKQTFTLKARKPYVKVGETFKGNVSIIAGTPATVSDLSSFKNRAYDPLQGIQETNAVDRYAAVKALPHRDEFREQGVLVLERLLSNKTEEVRVALEAAGSAAKMGSQMGKDRLVEMLTEDGLPYLKMEAIFILTELRGNFAEEQLAKLANEPQLVGSELRQAAIWGLGKAGLRAYDRLVPLIADEEDNAAMHAIVSFGHDTPEHVIQMLVRDLIEGNPRRTAAASEALRLSASESTVRLLVEAAMGGNSWVLATLGRLPSRLVKPITNGTILEEKIAPMLLLSEGAHWLSSEDRVVDIAFLAKQDIF